MSLSGLMHGPSAVPRKRHGNYGQPKPQSVTAARDRAVTGELKPDSKYLRSDVWQALPGSTPVPLMQRTGCCWAIGEPSPQHFCDMPKSGRSSYCEIHLKHYKTKETTE